MRRLLATAAAVLLLAVPLHVQTPAGPAGPPAFHLLFLGHDIGGETDTTATVSGGGASGQAGTPSLICAFHFVDRGGAVDLQATLTNPSAPLHLTVKGHNYRLFTSDSDVTITQRQDGQTLVPERAHVRDLTTERDINLDGKPFFPIDNYAPIGVQEALIQYWLAHGRPAAIEAAPSGPVVGITSRGMTSIAPDDGKPARRLERLAIAGVVWGTEAAWIDPATTQLVALTTWAGALPFEAIRDGWESQRDTFIAQGVADRIEDLKTLTTSVRPRAAGTFALVGARIVDATGAPPIESGAILVRDGKIAAIGPRASVKLPAGVRTIDVAGKTIIPGLWDHHAHASQVDWSPVYLASGVTSIRDMGGEEPYLIAIRDAIASGQALGPRYFLAGLIDGPGPGAFGMVTASTPDEARVIVDRYHGEHFNQIKIYQITPPALVPVITAEAHRLGMTVTGHVPNGMTWRSVVEDGYDGIAHMQLRGAPGSQSVEDEIAFFKAHNTIMDPTLSWNELAAHSAAQPLDSFLPGVGRLPVPLARMFGSMPGGSGRPQTSAFQLIKEAVDAGLLVGAGTDKGVPGFSLQRELELYVEGGVTPLQAIETATIMPAKDLGVDAELGTLEVGKDADLVVLDANPLENISNVRRADLVLAHGRLYDCDDLWRAAGYAPRGSGY